MTLLQREPKNIVMGEERVPGENTVMYYPFKDDQLDKVGGSSISITGTNETLGYTFSSSSNINFTNPPTSCRFISVWIKYNSNLGDITQSTSTYIGGVLYNFYNTNSEFLKKFQYHSTSTSSTLLEYPKSQTVNTSSGVRYHMAYGTDGSKVYAYLNGNKVWDTTITPGLKTETYMILLRAMSATVSDLIGEDMVRTADEISAYYNKTKSKYGL